MPLIDCFKNFKPADRDNILKRADVLKKRGLGNADEIQMSVKEYSDDVINELDNIYKQLGISEAKPQVAPVTPRKKKIAIVDEEIDNTLDELNKLLNSGIGATSDPQKDAERMFQIDQAAIKLVGLYIKKGVLKFADMMEQVYLKYGEAGVRNFMGAMKKNYAGVLVSSDDTEGMDDIATVKALKEDELIKSFQEEAPGAKEPDAFVERISGLIGTEKLGKREIEAIGREYGINDQNVIKELTELAIVQKARELAKNDDFEGLLKLYEDQPNLSHRTNESIEKQQYSTPAPIAYLGGKFINADQNESNFEPSAGNGMLTIVGDPKTYTVNEIDEVRLKNLKTQGYAKVTTQSGAEEFDTPKVHDAVITNPPFGGTDAIQIDGYKLNELAQIMSIRGLDTMKDNGKAFIIIGGNNKYDEQGRLTGRDRIFFNYLYNHYNVKDVIDITGDLYRKQGASFPIRVILVDGRKATPEGVAPNKNAFGDQVKSFEELKERIDKHVTPKNNENIQPAELVGGPASNPGGRGARPGSKTQPTTDDSVSEKPVSETGAGNKTPKPSTIRGGSVANPGAKSSPGIDSGVNPDESTLSEQPSDEGQSEQQQPGQSKGIEGNAEPRPKRDRKASVGNESGESTIEYKPTSKGKSFNVNTPASLQQEILDAQTDLENDVGDIDEFVRQRLGYKTIAEMHQGLGAEQVDGVALAIRNIERGTGIIIGDQPGIGKGRQAAAIVRYANQQGKTPIFLTKSAYLFTNFYGDLKDIGYGHIKPYIFNSRDATKFPAIFDADGKILHAVPTSGVSKRPVPKDAKIILATYSQFSSARYADKINLFRSLAADNIIIMDESHMASGDDSNTSAIFQDVLPTVRGVVYLSGTYAKRASSMPVYALKTSMREANMEPDELIEAIKKGGNPLQEINASILTETGEMVRRERTFKGIEVSTHIIGGDSQETKDRQIKQSDAVTEVMREIIDFQKIFVAPVVKIMDGEQGGVKVGGRKGTDLGGVTSSPYFQKVFNVINQLLYSIKAKDTAQLIIDEFKAGRKPFLAVRSTMEAMLNDLVERGELKIGDPVNSDFSFVIKKGLEGTLRITREDAQGNKTHESIPPTKLSVQGQLEYKRLLSKIANLKTGLTLSPIDEILKNLADAGLRVAEITGRKVRVDFRGDNAYLEVNKKLSINEAYRKYNSGEIDVLIVNRSGSTGASAHASEKVKDQTPRTMFVLENELDISELVQILFRVNRSGQVALPKYVFVSSSIPAEQRLMMMMMRKLKSLDANTTSNQKQSKGLIEVPEIFNKYGDQVVLEYLNDNPEINAEIGAPVKSGLNDAGEMVPEDGAANKVTGKIAVLSADKQAAFYSDITDRYNKYMDFLNEAGMNDLVIENLPLKAKTIKKDATIIGNGGRSAFGNDTFLENVEVNVLKKPMTKAEIDHQIKELGVDRVKEYTIALGEYENTVKEKTEKTVKEKFDKKVEAIENSKTLTPEIKEQEIAGINGERELFLSAKISADETKIQYIRGLLNFFKPGRAVMVPNDYANMRDGGTRPAIFLGFDIDISKPKAFLPSNVTLKFAINDSRRTLTLPASRDNLVNTIREFSYSLSESFKANTLKEWDTLKKPKDREKRYMVTGNILQGLGNESYRKGNIVKYSTEDGFINTGILLPESFDIEQEFGIEQISVPAKKALSIILQLPVGQSISTKSDGGDPEVVITKGRNRYSIRVPLPKQTGGKYYLNEGLKKIVQGGRWDSVGRSMEAFVDESRLEELLTALGNQFATSFMVDKSQMKSGPEGFVGMMRPAGKATGLDEIKPRAKKSGVKPFNVADRIKEVFKKHGVTINEGSLRKKYAGVYKYMTGGVRVQSLWDLFVASHEMTHAMDQRNKLSDRIQSQGTQKLKSEFIHAYKNLYPDPKKSASLNERIQEGMAMVVELYLNDPHQAQASYPEIVKHLLMPGGQFHRQEMTDFLDDMREITNDYYSLNPEEKINSRIKWDGTNKEGGVSTKIKVIHALTNDLITANMVDEMMGGELRAKAITPNVTMLRGVANIAGNWIRKPFGATDAPQTYIGNGMWATKKSPHRVEDLLKRLKTVEEITKFSDWLVARRQYSDYMRLDSIKDEIDNGNTDLQKYYDELSKIVENNQMPRDLVESVYYKFESKYQKEADIFDAINRDLVDFMEATELISKEKGDEYRASSGYASFQRFIEDDQQDIESLNLSTGTKSKLSQLRTRSGSSLQILPPVYSQIVAVGEVLRRGQLNLVWKAWAEAAKGNKDVAKMFEPVNPLDVKDKKDFQPVWENGVQKWYKLSEESRLFAQALSPDQVDLLNAFLRGAARSFQAMTTQFFAPFAAMNVTIDATTRFMQTKTGLIPFIHDAKTVKNAMMGLGNWMGVLSKQAPNDFEKYMSLGGRKQTLAGTMQLEPQDAIESVLNSDWVHKTKSGFEKAIKIVEAPVNMTELIGRGTEFQRALAKGYPTNVAMHMAANVGINFSNKGNLAVNYLRSVAYMGAGIQAFSQFLKIAKDNPQRVSMAIGIMATIAASGALATYMYGDDDEKMQLANQNPEELAKYLFMPASIFGLKSGLIKIRVPEQGGNIAAAVQLYLQHQYMDNEIGFDDVYRSQESALPRQLQFSQGLGIIGSYLPQAVSPSIQALTNTRFYPHLAPIVPDWMDDLDEYSQYDKYTSRTAKAIGDLTRDSFMELSPKKIDFMIRAQGGRAVALVQGLAESAIFGDPMKTYVNIFEESDRFMLTGRLYNRFYELREEAKEELKALRLEEKRYIFSDHIIDAEIRVDDLEAIHEDLMDMGERMRNGENVSIEERRQMFKRLQAIEMEDKELK